VTCASCDTHALFRIVVVSHAHRATCIVRILTRLVCSNSTFGNVEVVRRLLRSAESIASDRAFVNVSNAVQHVVVC
jgi:hypothetical protein